MYEEIKVSIFVLCNGKKQNLEKCIETLVGQSHSLYEAFLLADSSCISQEELSEMTDDGRFEAFVEDNAQTDARLFDIGFCHICSSSKYWLCIDGNDEIDREYIYQMISVAERETREIVFGLTKMNRNDRRMVGYSLGSTWNKMGLVNVDWNTKNIGRAEDAEYRRAGEGIIQEAKSEVVWNKDRLYSAITDPQYKYVSFDIFDTLIVRPFMVPTDMFELLDASFEKETHANISFKNLRIIGEELCRQRKCNAEIEDVTIDEIYQEMEEKFSIAPQILEKLKIQEKNLEISMSNARKAIKEMYDLALENNKKVILISDMYLGRDTIQRILEKNGIRDYEGLYVSSEYRKLKSTSNLFKLVLDELGIEPGQMIHIGDNIHSDLIAARSAGIRSFNIATTVDMFGNDKKALGVQSCDYMTREVCGKLVSYAKMNESLGYRCMTAMVANKFLDSPFEEFAKNSILNGDPYFLGYYLVGMYLLGLNKWVSTCMKNGNYTKVIFLSRDGWLPMQAYNLLRKRHPSLPEADYFYVSRKAVMPAMVREKLDLYDLPIDYSKYDAMSLFELLDFCADVSKEEWRLVCENNDISSRETFDNQRDYWKAIELFCKNAYSEKKHLSAIKCIEPYFEQVPDNCVMFDMGYSGRIQNAINRLAKKRVDVMFVHRDTQKSFAMERKGNFEIFDLWGFVPQMSDALRELLLSEPAQSCIGYENKNGECQPQFDSLADVEKNFGLVKIIQSGAMDFVEEFYTVFGEYLEHINFKETEVMLPLEGFMRCSETGDRDMFREITFDDAVYGHDEKINMKQLIELERKWLPENQE